MTKLAITAIIILGVLIASGAYYYGNKVIEKNNDSLELQAYYARREDLMGAQLQLESAISQINQTLQEQMELQKKLTHQVEVLAIQANTTVPNITLPTITVPTIIIPTHSSSSSSSASGSSGSSTPAVTPPPPPVTAAS
jgi:hypothetical protein